MAVYQVGVQGAKFGLTDESWGYINNLRENTTAEETTLEDGDNDVVAAAYHHKVKEVSFDFIIKNSTLALDDTDVQSSITVADADYAGQTIYVREVERTKTKDGWYAGRATGSVFFNLSTTA